MTGFEQSEDDRFWQLDGFLAETMHDAVVKLVALNNKLVAMRIFGSGSVPNSANQKVRNEGMDIKDEEALDPVNSG